MLSSFYPCIEYFGFVLFPVFKVIIAAIKVTMYLMEFASNLHGVFCVLQFHRQIEADCNDITEILFKVALSTNILSQPSSLSPSLLLVCDNCCMPPATKLQVGILVSPCPSVCRQIICRTIYLSCVSQNLLKFYQLFTGEERRIPFIYDDFHFCRSRVIGLDMTEKRIFTLCRMIT